MKKDVLIESILYFKGEPVTKKELAKILNTDTEAIKNSLLILKGKLIERGIVLIENEESVSLGTSPDSSEIIKKLTQEELDRDLGKAGIETLTIVAYKGPISRNNVDNIRGVNSSFILRNLLIRGLVEKIIDPNDQRAFLYKPTINLLQYLGIKRIEDLPEYVTVINKLNATLSPEDESQLGEETPTGGEKNELL
ncbi:MAG: SMC-Scp complex subunit ScpB [bacterium]